MKKPLAITFTGTMHLSSGTLRDPPIRAALVTAGGCRTTEAKKPERRPMHQRVHRPGQVAYGEAAKQGRRQKDVVPLSGIIVDAASPAGQVSEVRAERHELCAQVLPEKQDG